MEYRTLGRTGLRVSALGFGCGDVGGLMVRGTPAERERGVARALEHGINYLDTAPAYGSGESEKNLGQVLRALKPAAIVGTKWRLAAAALADGGRGVAPRVRAEPWAARTRAGGPAASAQPDRARGRRAAARGGARAGGGGAG